jgi:hypothetical protein
VTGDGNFLQRLVDLLNSAGISYMIAGSVASNIYGHPRTTNDVDIVVAASEAQFDRFLNSLGDLYCNVSSGRQAIESRMFNVIDFSVGMKADLVVRKDRDFSRSEFARRRIADVEGVRAFVMSAEDAILSKLEWCKMGEPERQYRDAFNVAALMWHDLDMPYLKKWAVELNIEYLLQRLLNEARPPQS